jgi:hypothetical protein
MKLKPGNFYSTLEKIANILVGSRFFELENVLNSKEELDNKPLITKTHKKIKKILTHYPAN